MIELLLSYNAFIDYQDSNRETPLMNAIVFGQYEVVKLLLEKGARTGFVDITGDDEIENSYHYITPQRDEIIAYLSWWEIKKGKPVPLKPLVNMLNLKNDEARKYSILALKEASGQDYAHDSGKWLEWIKANNKN